MYNLLFSFSVKQDFCQGFLFLVLLNFLNWIMPFLFFIASRILLFFKLSQPVNSAHLFSCVFNILQFHNVTFSCPKSPFLLFLSLHILLLFSILSTQMFLFYSFYISTFVNSDFTYPNVSGPFTFTLPIHQGGVILKKYYFTFSKLCQIVVGWVPIPKFHTLMLHDLFCLLP